MSDPPPSKRDELIEIAQHVVATRGIAGTRLADVAEVAGLTTPALYSHFSSRVDLLEVVLETTAREYVEDLRLTDDPAASVEERLRVRFTRWADQPDTRLRILNQAVLDMQESERVGNAVAGAQTAWREFIGDVLSRGLSRGEVRPDLDLDATIDLLSASFLGAQISATSDLVERGLAPLLSGLLDMFLAYVLINPA